MAQRSFAATLQELPAMVEFLAAECRALGASESVLAKIDLATEEALVNTIHHGYPLAVGQIQIAVQDWMGEGVQITLEDTGVEFNPLDRQEPEHLELPPEERPMGGLGIFLMRKVMDEVHYTRDGAINRLVLRKKFATHNTNSGTPA